MSITKPIGKNTLGQGKKMNIELKSYGMTTVDLSKRQKTKAEAVKVQGADTENTNQQTAESRARQALAEINTKYETQAIDWKLDKIAQESNVALGEAQSALAKGAIDSDMTVVETRIRQIKQEALNAAIQATAMESGIKLNEARVNEIGADVK